MNWATAPAWAAPAVALAYVQARIVVPRLREPPDGVELGKTPYAALPTAPRLAVLAVLAACAGLVTALAPVDQRGLWLVLGSSVLVLVWVDAVTTWIPAVLARAAFAQMVLAVGLGAFWSPDPGWLALRALAGAAAAFGLWWLLWRVTRGGLGYGDVRLATLIGAVTGAHSSTLWLGALLAGSLLGVVWGLARRRAAPAPGTARGFAYGPALWLGPYAAFAWLSAVS